MFERRSATELVLTEDAAKLHCHCSPMTAALFLSSADESRTEVRIEGSIAGRGPIAGKRAREQTDALTRKLGLAAVSGEARGVRAGSK